MQVTTSTSNYKKCLYVFSIQTFNSCILKYQLILFLSLKLYPRIAKLTKIWKKEHFQNNAALRQENQIMDLNHLKNALWKPKDQKQLAPKKKEQLQSVIDLRQKTQLQSIMSLLRRKGLLLDLPTGGNIILSSPNTIIHRIFPRYLKTKHVKSWTKEEHILLNV